MARKGRTKVSYEGTFVSKQSLILQTMTKKVNTLKCAGQAHLLKGPVSFLYQSNFCSKPNQVKGEKIVLFKMTESN